MLRKRRVLPPDAGWLSALGSRFPAHWLENERRQSGSLWTPWGWEGVRLGPQLATGLVFFGFVVVLWLLADAGQAIIDRWNAADDTLPGPVAVIVLIAIVAVGLAMAWASVVVLALASFARGRLRPDETLGLVFRGRCPESWKANPSQ